MNDDGNPILGSATQDGPKAMDRFCNPDDPNECIWVPRQQKERLYEEDEDGPIEFAEMCNPEDPTDCVWVPMPGEGESARDGDNSDPLNPPHFLGWDTDHGEEDKKEDEGSALADLWNDLFGEDGSSSLAISAVVASAILIQI